METSRDGGASSYHRCTVARRVAADRTGYFAGRGELACADRVSHEHRAQGSWITQHRN